jgi:hypothetical protein
MAIHTVGGDLFVHRAGAQALAQGVNCQGFMGAADAKRSRANSIRPRAFSGELTMDGRSRAGAAADPRAGRDRGCAPRIAAPRIGAGYGGLSWKKPAPIFSTIFADWPGDFYLYETYLQEDVAQV